MLPRLGTLKLVILLNHIEIMELMTMVITTVIITSITIFFEEYRNFMREINPSFSFCAYLPLIDNFSSNSNEDWSFYFDFLFLASYI